MAVLWKHVVARFKPRLSYTDLESIMRSYATASTREEPILTYAENLRKADPSRPPVDDLLASFDAQLRDIASMRTKAEQARECRVLLLEQIDRSVPDHFLSRGGDESLRHVCLSAIYNLETEDDIRRKEGEALMSFCSAIWAEAALRCMYQEYFESYMPLEDFSQPYRAMTELYMRFLCAKLFSSVMSEHDRLDLQKVSEAYERACTDSTVLELGDIRRHYFDAIRGGFTDHLYPLQQRFAKISKTAQASIEDALSRERYE